MIYFETFELLKTFEASHLEPFNFKPMFKSPRFTIDMNPIVIMRH